MPVSRRQIIRALKARDWQIQPEPLKELEAYLRPYDGVDENFLDLLGQHFPDSSQRTLTNDVWQAFLSEEAAEFTKETTPTQPEEGGQDPSSLVVSTPTSKGSSNPWSDLQVVSAFRDVRLVYHNMKKHFYVEEQPWSLFGTAEDKIQMHSQRYILAHQRLLRNKLFRPSDLARVHTASDDVQYKLTPIESLLGRQRHQTQKSLLLLGLLQQVEEGQYYLEDMTGQVPVSFQNALIPEAVFVAEGNITIVEGCFQDGILQVQKIGHPLLEERYDSLSVIQQQVRHPAFSFNRYDQLYDSDAPIVVLSDVHLDQPRVLQQLEALFASYENYSRHRLPLFCLLGNFCSQLQLHSGELVQQCLEDLASLLVRFPKLAAHAHFCLVPGPHDGVGHVLPYSWPKSLTAMACWNKIPNAHLTSNPAKILWKGRTMTLFRQNVLSLLQQRQLNLPVAEQGGEEEDSPLPHQRLVKTLLDQGHLMPFAGAPIYWNYDHALRLYPLPDILVMGSTDSAAFHERYGGVDVIHPGSFAKQGDFARCVPVRCVRQSEDYVELPTEVSLHQVDENWKQSPSKTTNKNN